MKTKKLFLSAFVLILIFCTSFFHCAYSQVTIGSLQDPRATLEVVARPDGVTADGIMAPRVSRRNLNDNESKYTASQEGAIVYVETIDGNASGQAVSVKSEGYYYFDGQVWLSLKGLHVIKGVTASEDHIFTIPNSMPYVSKGNGINYFQSSEVWVSPNNYIVLPPGVWKVEFSLPVMVNQDIINKNDWLEGLAFFTTNSALTSYSDAALVSDGGIGLPHLSQTKKGYIERGFGWCFIRNNTSAPITCYMGFGRLNLNRDGDYYVNEWFGASLTLFPSGRTAYLYATMVGHDYK